MIPIGDVPVLVAGSRHALPYYGRATARRVARAMRRLRGTRRTALPRQRPHRRRAA